MYIHISDMICISLSLYIYIYIYIYTHKHINKKDQLMAYECNCGSGYEMKAAEGSIHAKNPLGNATCVPVICGGSPKNAFSTHDAPVKTDYDTPQWTYTCDEGYSLTGVAGGTPGFTARCMSTGAQTHISLSLYIYMYTMYIYIYIYIHTYSIHIHIHLHIRYTNTYAHAHTTRRGLPPRGVQACDLRRHPLLLSILLLLVLIL